MLQLSDLTLEDIFLKITMGDAAAVAAAGKAEQSSAPKLKVNVKDGELVASELAEGEKEELLVDKSFDPDDDINEGGDK